MTTNTLMYVKNDKWSTSDYIIMILMFCVMLFANCIMFMHRNMF